MEALLMPCRSNMADMSRATCGQTVVKQWSMFGQILVKPWSNSGQPLVEHWSNSGQPLVKNLWSTQKAAAGGFWLCVCESQVRMHSV
jgi:hypothetical protein